jgi:hypothetical protein
MVGIHPMQYLHDHRTKVYSNLDLIRVTTSMPNKESCTQIHVV